MRARSLCAVLVFALVPAASSAQSGGQPAAGIAEIIMAFLKLSKGTDWESAQSLPAVKWAAPAPRELQNCLPDGGCYALQGAASIGGRNLVAMATGARTILNSVYLRNAGAPIGEAAVMDALKGAGVTAELARCPVQGSRGGSSWYRLTGDGLGPAVMMVQSSCNGRPCEGFVLSLGEELPALQPAQVRLYSEQCAAGTERKAVSSLLPHQAIAEAIVALVPPSTGPPGYDWKGLAGLAAGITWNGDAPKAMALTHLNDPNPMAMTGTVTLGGRQFSTIASGSATQAKVIYLDELGMHPRGEHVLGVVYEKGLAVRLVRCGPVYSQSTNNWYQMTSDRTRPVMIRQSIRYDGNQVQDVYELRLDGTLPARDPRDRDPGVNGCR